MRLVVVLILALFVWSGLSLFTSVKSPLDVVNEFRASRPHSQQVSDDSLAQAKVATAVVATAAVATPLAAVAGDAVHTPTFFDAFLAGTLFVGSAYMMLLAFVIGFGALFWVGVVSEVHYVFEPNAGSLYALSRKSGGRIVFASLFSLAVGFILNKGGVPIWSTITSLYGLPVLLFFIPGYFWANYRIRNFTPKCLEARKTLFLDGFCQTIVEAHETLKEAERTGQSVFTGRRGTIGLRGLDDQHEFSLEEITIFTTMVAPLLRSREYKINAELALLLGRILQSLRQTHPFNRSNINIREGALRTE